MLPDLPLTEAADTTRIPRVAGLKASPPIGGPRTRCGWRRPEATRSWPRQAAKPEEAVVDTGGGHWLARPDDRLPCLATADALPAISLGGRCGPTGGHGPCNMLYYTASMEQPEERRPHPDVQ
jgi:hypothetical protein